MTALLTALAILTGSAFFISSAIALMLCHLERMADIARNEVDV